MNGKWQGVSQSDTEALIWYRQATEQGDAKAQCNLGGRYGNGRGISQSGIGAVKWFKQASVLLAVGNKGSTFIK